MIWPLLARTTLLMTGINLLSVTGSHWARDFPAFAMIVIYVAWSEDAAKA